ncbi:hypothetical protein [uncultured Eubacterium sp.]|uniref:hypothetical protein n=1 Tax=uncultured Eubacterium sp. TaxID=165185 RepID=UPI0025998A0A|nr:hypothetical protein [uncultured Eubacterium sp.]
MTNEEFETQMRKILKKAGEASGLGFENESVSVDPDRLADYGVDYEGNLAIYERSYPLKVSDIIAIQYRWNECDEWEESNGCFRFKFKNGLYFYIMFSNDAYGIYNYYIEYGKNSEGFGLNTRDIPEYLNSILESDDNN